MNFKTILGSLLIVMISTSLAFAATSEMPAASASQNLTLPKGTSIKVQAVNDISSQNARQNMKVQFKVVEDILIEDVILIPANTNVEAVVTKVKKAGPWDKDGEIEVAFSEVAAKEGHSFPVTGKLHIKGDKPNILVRYSLGGVLVKGKQAVIKAGTEAKLETKEDVKFRKD